MLRPRLIPTLLVKDKGLVKTVGFSKPKYVGDPINAVRIFNEKHVDELIVADIDASREQREPDYKLISNLASECRMPLCYVGGVKRLDQIERIISLGVEKIGLDENNAVVTTMDVKAWTEISVYDVVGEKFADVGKYKVLCTPPYDSNL